MYPYIIEITKMKSENDHLNRIEFDHPVAAVTPGQSAVLYQNEVCLGGGTIKERIKLTDGH